MNDVVQILIAVAAFVILFFAYTAGSKLGRIISFIILASILLTQILIGFAGLISGVAFLDFLEQIFRGIADIIVYIELGLIVFVTFFKFGTKNMFIKVSAMVYVVLVLLVQFGVF